MNAPTVLTKTAHMNFASYCLMLMRGKGDALQSYEISRNTPGISPTVPAILKNAVEMATTTSPEYAALAPYQQDAQAFAESLRPISVLDALAPFTRVLPLRTSLAVSASAILGGDVTEGARKPLRKLSINATNIEHSKVAAEIVVSNELGRFAHAAGTQLLNNELRASVAAASNLSALATLAAAVSTAGNQTSTGSVLGDIAQAAAVIATDGAPGQLFWVMSPAAARAIATLPDGTGNKAAFPAFDLLRGGPIVPGVVGLVTTEVPTGKSMFINPANLSLSLDPIVVRASSVANYDPDDATGTGASAQVSAWQTGATVYLCERHYAVHPYRDGVAIVDGETYVVTP